MNKNINDCFYHQKNKLMHDEALDIIRTQFSAPLEKEKIRLDYAAGRVCAKDIYSQIQVPYNTNSAVDGYAFKHADLEKSNQFQIIGRVAAGSPIHHYEKENTAFRIFTGAPMPLGTDSVVMQEDIITHDNDRIQIPAQLKQGANCRLAGEDITKESLIISKGTHLSASDLAQIASTGRDHIEVFRKLKIMVITTGDEIIAPGQEIDDGEVYNANAFLITSLLKSPLIEQVNQYHLSDDFIETKKTLSDMAPLYDLIITIGGASKGEEDHVHHALNAIGKCHLWQLAIKPGGSMLMGQIGHCLMVGLPGNPVAAFTCFSLYVRQIIRQICGINWQLPSSYFFPANFEIKHKKVGRKEFLRGTAKTVEKQTLLNKYERDGSGLISSLRHSSGLIILPEDITKVSKGYYLEYIPFEALKLG